MWKVAATDTEVAGFVKAVSGSDDSPPFYWAVVRDSGHMVPYDQPVRALDMITRFVENIPFLSEG